MHRSKPPLFVTLLVAFLLLGTGVNAAFAQAGAGAKSKERRRAAPLLHEPLPRSARSLRSDSVVRAKSGDVSAIQTAAGRIDKPERPPRNAPQAPLYDAPSRDRARVKSDRRTDADGTLHYRAVFNPTVAPFKRDMAFDRVTADGELEQSGDGLRAIRPRGRRGLSDAAERSGHRLFWGHVTVELVPGKRTPLPSVAPSADLISADTAPLRTLSFFRDVAGNLSVTATRKGTVSLRYLMDAPSTYFAAPVGSGPATNDPFKPRLHTAIQRRMQQLWPALGVSLQQPRKAVLEKLVEHFRGFEPGTLDGRLGGDLLVDLIVARKGVCRHRAHAFTVMAQSLGIPTLYVINDAHAFVEVWLSGSDGRGRWQRIDLGGGADTLRLHGADGRQLHDPVYRDPFPRPDAYTNGFTNLVADGRLNDSSWAGARRVVGAGGLVGRAGGTRPGHLARTARATVAGRQAAKPGANGARTADGGPARSGWLRKRALERATIARNVAAPSRPPGQRTAPPPSANNSRLATRLTLSPIAPVAYVGETLIVRGRLQRADGGQAAGLPIEVWLVEPREPSKGTKLGTVVTGKGGKFAAKVAVPIRAPLGERDLVVYFPGRGRLAPSYSRE